MIGKLLATLIATISVTAFGADLAAAAPSRGAAAGVATVACGPAGARTLAAGRVARVYSHAGRVYGCSRDGHGSYLLGAASNCNMTPVVSTVMLTGELAAYGLQRCGVDFATSQVIVSRLTDGHRLRALAATIAHYPEAFQSVRSIALKSDGAVAWIGFVSSIVGNRAATEVHEANAGGVPTLLDSGAGIGAGSLRLRGSRLSWRHGRGTRTATLTRASAYTPAVMRPRRSQRLAQRSSSDNAGSSSWPMRES